MTPELAKALELAEAARRHLLQAQRSNSVLKKEDHTAAADELLATQMKLLRSAA